MHSTDTWTMNQAAHPSTNVHLCAGSGNRDPKGECYEDKSVIAQPVFVFKRKERYCKRPAEVPVCKTENVVIDCPRKRARASYFSLQTSDSQPYREKKKSIFMTSALLQKNADVTAADKDLSSPVVQRDILRPAILQPPQVPLQKEVKKVCEETYSQINGSGKPSLSLHFSAPKTIGNQQPEGRTFSNSRHSNFVFGENIVERVLSPEKYPQLHSECGHNNEGKSRLTKCSHINSPWITFSKNTTLIESAAAYASDKPMPRYLLDKVEVTTGEEAEHNVLQINCRLFVFNKVSLTWTERGSGSLRLNDTSSNGYGMLQSRLVMRNQGSMRLILNTKLWTQMVIEKANRKSLCIIATDLEDESVKIFLIQASSKDTNSLYAAIHHRLVALRSFAGPACDANSAELEPDNQSLNGDSDDEENEKISQVNNNESDRSRWIRRQSVICS